MERHIKLVSCLSILGSHQLSRWLSWAQPLASRYPVTVSNSGWDHQRPLGFLSIARLSLATSGAGLPHPSPQEEDRYLQPAAKPLHRTPAGGHGVAEQEYQDTPLLNQPPQHRAARWLWGPARVEPEGQSRLSISSSHCPTPSFGTPWLPNSHSKVEGISQVRRKKENKKKKAKKCLRAPEHLLV